MGRKSKIEISEEIKRKRAVIRQQKYIAKKKSAGLALIWSYPNEIKELKDEISILQNRLKKNESKLKDLRSGKKYDKMRLQSRVSLMLSAICLVGFCAIVYYPPFTPFWEGNVNKFYWKTIDGK